MNPVAAPRVALSALVTACARHRLPVILLFLCLATASLAATVAWLGVTTDTGELFDANLPWKQRSADLARLFPQNDKLIVAVVDAAVPEVADATAASLADALAHLIRCAPKARTTSGGRFHPESCRLLR